MPEENEVLRRRVAEIAGPIFEAALQRKQKKDHFDSTVRSSYAVSVLWRPNNYRRKMLIKKVDDTTLKSLGGVYQKISVSKKKLVFIRDDPRITLQVGRSQLTAFWAQRKIAGSKETFCIETDSLDGVSSFVDGKVEQIKQQIDAVMKDFLVRTNLGLPASRAFWERHEDWFRGEDYIDKLPRKAIFYDDVVKKVYDDGLEFQGGGHPGVTMLNYLRERSVEQMSPQISARLSSIEAQQKIMIKMLEELRVPYPIPPPPSQRRMSRFCE